MVPGSGKLLCASCLNGEHDDCEPHIQSEWKQEVYSDDVVLQRVLEKHESNQVREGRM